MQFMLQRHLYQEEGHKLEGLSLGDFVVKYHSRCSEILGRIALVSLDADQIISGRVSGTT